jgi:hypothetical protein
VSPSKKLVLTGYASDLATVLPALTVRAADTFVMDENSFEKAFPKHADVVVFALSHGATYSTQLRLVCNRVYARVSAPRKYLLPVGDVDLDERRFPEFIELPTITLAGLNGLLREQVTRTYRRSHPPRRPT